MGEELRGEAGGEAGGVTATHCGQLQRSRSYRQNVTTDMQNNKLLPLQWKSLKQETEKTPEYI